MCKRLIKRVRRKWRHFNHVEDAWLTTSEDPAQRGERVLSIPAYYFGIAHNTHPGQRADFACVDLIWGRMFEVELGQNWVRVYVSPHRARSMAYTKALASRYLSSFLRDDAMMSESFRT